MIRTIINISDSNVILNDLNGKVLEVNESFDGLTFGIDKLKSSLSVTQALIEGTIKISDGNRDYEGIKGIDLIKEYATQFTKDGKPITTSSDRPENFYRCFTGVSDNLDTMKIGSGHPLVITVPVGSLIGNVECRFVDNIYLKDGEAIHEHAPFGTKFHCSVICPANVPFPSPNNTGNLDYVNGSFIPNISNTGGFTTSPVPVTVFKFINGIYILGTGKAKVTSVEPFMLNFPYYLKFELEVPDIQRETDVRIAVSLGLYRQKLFRRCIMSNYQIEKHKIKNGSLVFLKAKKLSHKIVTLITGGSYSHCGLAFWVSDACGSERLLLVEAHYGGCRIINLSSYSNRDILILDVGLKWESVGDFILEKTGRVPYGFIDFILVGVKDIITRTILLKYFNKFIPNTYGEICSEFLANILKKADYSIEDTLCSPEQLLKMIESNKWVNNSFEIKS